MQGSRDAARVFHSNITPRWDFILFRQLNMSPICISTDELLLLWVSVSGCSSTDGLVMTFRSQLREAYSITIYSL